MENHSFFPNKIFERQKEIHMRPGDTILIIHGKWEQKYVVIYNFDGTQIKLRRKILAASKADAARFPNDFEMRNLTTPININYESTAEYSSPIEINKGNTSLPSCKNTE